ncbi:hypothetical protein [Nonomuraea sp. NPDC049480]|uniref:hypothetical protein n=1 Tax=Nonomuraea sp. NPDC049480 TaxID=3364353 RepID=UPI0037947A87
MSTPSSLVGCRAKIVDMLHSPARTRAVDNWLLGRRGTVVGVLRNGTLALVEVDGKPDEMPGGVRRWPVHWDDLHVQTVQPAPQERRTTYQLGLSHTERDAVHHAVPANQEISLCGKSVHPLPVLGWSLSFLPTAKRACPTCVHLIERGS